MKEKEHGLLRNRLEADSLDNAANFVLWEATMFCGCLLPRALGYDWNHNRPHTAWYQNIVRVSFAGLLRAGKLKVAHASWRNILHSPTHNVNVESGYR